MKVKSSLVEDRRKAVLYGPLFKRVVRRTAFVSLHTSLHRHYFYQPLLLLLGGLLSCHRRLLLLLLLLPLLANVGKLLRSDLHGLPIGPGKLTR